MTKVYKVVRRRRDGKLASTIVKSGKLLVIYDPGKPSYAVNGMKLLAFSSKPTAKEFALKANPEEIWEAEAENARLQDYLEFSEVTWRAFKAFWEGHGSSWGVMKAPLGTVACDSITLIKRVDNGAKP